MTGADRRRVGVVVVPKYFDTSAQELHWLAPNVDVLHTQMRLGRDFGYKLEEIIGAVDEIEGCAAALADAGSEVVVQLGTPFSTAHGFDGGMKVQETISERISVPFEMMGISVPMALYALGVRRVALAAVYYPVDWTTYYAAFLSGAGIQVVGAQDFADQGRMPDSATAWAGSFDGFDPAIVIDSVVDVGASYPDADAIVVLGMPGKILHHVRAAESFLGRPIVSYYAVWWNCLMHLGVVPSVPAGRLFELLP